MRVSEPNSTEEPIPQTLQDRGDELLRPRNFAILLGLLIFATFPQVLLGVRTFVVRDFGFFAYPLAYFQRECFWRGELPFWNPYNNCGVPFLAQWNTMPLYPPALLYLLLPLNWSLGFFCLVHLFWAGLGMYFLAHRWTRNAVAASIAGVLFAFNGLSLNLLMWPSHIATLSWMPWVVLCVERALRQGGRHIIVAAVCGVLQMLAGGPETILMTWGLLTLMWSAQLASRIRKIQRKKTGAASRHQPSPGHDAYDAETQPANALLWRFPLIVLLVAALATIQLLPFLDLAAHSQREPGYADTRWSIPSRGWAHFFVPLAFGSISPMGVFFQHDQSWTSSYYLGMGGLLLTGLALWKWRRMGGLLAIIAALSVLLALGDKTFVYRGLRRLIPQLSLMTYPVKFMIVAVFAVPVLSALNFCRWTTDPQEQRPRYRRRLFICASIILALIGIAIYLEWRSPMRGDDFRVAFRNGVGRAVFLLAIFALLLIWQRASGSPPTQSSTLLSRRSLTRFLPFALLSMLWLDVRTHEPNQNPSAPPSVYMAGLARTKLAMQPQPNLGQSRAMLTPLAATKFREVLISSAENKYLVKRIGYFADCNLLDNVPKVDGFFSIAPRHCDDLISVLYGATNASYPALMDFMSVSQITAPGEFFKWHPRETFLPFVTD